MFKSVQRAPLCTIGSSAARLQGLTAYRQVNSSARGVQSGPAAWLESLFTRLHKSMHSSSEKKSGGLLSILADHCGFVTGQRLRRAFQIAELYSNLYSERSRWTLVGNIWRRLQNKHAPTGKLLAALVGVFMWDDERIRDDEMRRSAA